MISSKEFPAMSSTTKLFQPIKVGRLPLKHRVVLAALTRLRAKPVPSLSPLPRIVKEYYTQRASVPGTLLISEGTIISAKAGGYPNAPGIWSEEQITAWKEVSRNYLPTSRNDELAADRMIPRSSMRYMKRVVLYSSKLLQLVGRPFFRCYSP